ncbi:hypothetical protein chiPu_0019778 [Chiloscyllium punctatum]|uniref:FGAR-AT PurM N-terminal-like domain-containing protein n=1 Tax=Chiloscyllium punctatum TaxID=137246 RepID=A0A401RT65_CHIPU|nr:hypothetical protein [Chiloscyllium punctatum]
MLNCEDPTSQLRKTFQEHLREAHELRIFLLRSTPIFHSRELDTELPRSRIRYSQHRGPDPVPAQGMVVLFSKHIGVAVILRIIRCYSSFDPQVDRSVTGLVAQQQCVGPLHTPLADVAVVALSYFDTVGAATAIGEQPIKGLIDPAAGARMAIGEALTNLMFARVTELSVSV